MPKFTSIVVYPSAFAPAATPATHAASAGAQAVDAFTLKAVVFVPIFF